MSRKERNIFDISLCENYESLRTHNHILTIWLINVLYEGFTMKKFLFLIVALFLLNSCDKDNNKLVWTVINVNSTGKQGDAHLISKNGKHFMIDTGQYYYVKRTLLPFLHSKHISYIDSILITHPHFDHYGGLVSIMQSDIKVGKIYMNIPTKNKVESEPGGGRWRYILDILNAAKKYHVPIIPIKAGDKYIFDKNSYFEVLYQYDGEHTPVGKTDINGMSAVMMLHNGKNRFLFTGDLSQKIGDYIASNFNNLKADILKFPHHGAVSHVPKLGEQGFPSKIFFQKVSPKVVIVPAPKTIWCSKLGKRARELVKDNNYTTYVNGFNGNISVVSDGKSYKIIPEKSSKLICPKQK